MNRASVPGLDALLNRPSAAVLPAPLRQALREHWEAPECDHQMRASWSVLGDTLDALSMLSADEGAVVAALLFDLPGLRASLDQLPLGNHKAAVIGLLDGQDAADPVWALHAGREAGRTARACAACCWRSSATCAWCRSCWPGSWRECALPTSWTTSSAGRWRS